MKALLHVDPSDLADAALGKRISMGAWVHLMACPTCKNDAAALFVACRRRRRRVALAAATAAVLLAIGTLSILWRPLPGGAVVAPVGSPAQAEIIDPAAEMAGHSHGRLTLIEAREIMLLAALQKMVIGTPGLVASPESGTTLLPGLDKLESGDAGGAVEAFAAAPRSPLRAAMLAIARYAAGADDELTLRSIDSALEALPAADSSSARVAVIWVRARLALETGNHQLARTLLSSIANGERGGFRSLAAGLVNEIPPAVRRQ